MSDINLVKAHGAQSLDEAKRLVQEALGGMRSQLTSYIADVRWNEDNSVANVKGKGVEGTFTIDPTNITVRLKLGFLVKMFKGPIESKLDDIIQREVVEKAAANRAGGAPAAAQAPEQAPAPTEQPAEQAVSSPAPVKEAQAQVESSPAPSKGEMPVKGGGAMPIKGGGEMPVKGGGEMPVKGGGEMPVKGK